MVSLDSLTHGGARGRRLITASYSIIGNFLLSYKNTPPGCKVPFTLLSDTELSCIQAYDVWKEKKLYGKVSMGVVRTTYLIDENGIIEKAYDKVKAADNPAQMLGELA